MKITVEVEDVSDALILHQEVGTGTYGKTKFTLCSAMPTGSPIVKIGKKRYMVKNNDICEAICKKVAK